jgi:hypothetical protein
VRFNGALVIREHNGKVFYEAKWRDATGRQVKRRVGEAWLERDASGAWRPRRGRLDDGCLDKKSAIVEMNRLITEHDSLVAVSSACPAVTFDELAAAWLHHVEHVDGIKPSTLKRYRYMLGAPGDRARKRGCRRAGARIMREFGGQAIDSITTTQVERWLEALDAEDIPSAPSTRTARSCARSLSTRRAGPSATG